MLESELRKFSCSRFLRASLTVATIVIYPKAVVVHALQPMLPTFRTRGISTNYLARQIPFEASKLRNERVISPQVLRLGNLLGYRFCRVCELRASSNNQEEKNSNSSSPSSLNKFRKLMGTLYGIAGLAHFVDCYVGPSALLASAGLEPYTDLSYGGKVCVFLWCAVGPLAFLLSRLENEGSDNGENNNINPADLGIIIYGAVEVGCSILASLPDVGDSKVPLHQIVEHVRTSSIILNTLAVQMVVALSWLYSANENEKGSEGSQ